MRVLLEWKMLVNAERVMAKREGATNMHATRGQRRRLGEDGDGDAQRMQLDERVAGASSSGDGAAHSVTETGPQQPQAGAASDATTQPMLPSQENRSTVGPPAAENSTRVVSLATLRPHIEEVLITVI